MAHLMALGRCVFRVIGLNAQEIETTSEAIWAEFGRFGLIDGAQRVGLHRASQRIHGVLFPDAIGGLADYEAIRAAQYAGRPVSLLRMGRGFTATVLGTVTIERVSDLETWGGQKIAFDVEVKAYAGG